MDVEDPDDDEEWDTGAGFAVERAREERRGETMVRMVFVAMGVKCGNSESSRMGGEEIGGWERVRSRRVRGMRGVKSRHGLDRRITELIEGNG